MFPKLICVIACVRRSLFFYWWVLHSMFICLPVDRHLGCFQSWLLGLDCYGHLCTSFCKYVFISLQKIPKSRAAELEGGQLLNFIGNCQTGLQSGCTFFFFLPALYDKVFQSLHILTKFWCYSLFNFSHSNECDMIL